MTGQRFGRLTVLADLGRVGGRCRVLCLCDCGARKEMRADHVRSGRAASCGCLAGEAARRNGLLAAKHLHTTAAGYRSPEYNSWTSMRTRCLNPRADNYAKYGGRGIGVCDRWARSFVAFLEDMGPRPAGTTLDRIDGRKGYWPENARWATAKEQRHNRVQREDA